MDLAKEEVVVKKLCEENEEFKKLFNEHADLEGKLAEIDRKHYIGAEEEMERKKLQKVKLAGKDRMFQIIRDHKAKAN
jgi:uncharacterized protein YdcH (DUF465 family)